MHTFKGDGSILVQGYQGLREQHERQIEIIFILYA